MAGEKGKVALYRLYMYM